MVYIFHIREYSEYGGNQMSETNIDVRGETCPVPLVECRKAIRKTTPGNEIIIVGTHPASRKEILMACEAMGLEVREVDEINEKEWKIRIRR
jgi:TusA-related sulfurtransferase